MEILWFGVFLVILSLVYAFGWQRGYDQGHQDGEEDGIQKGLIIGEKIGIEKGVTERVLNSLKGNKGGILEETEAQVRERLYAKLTSRPSPPAAVQPNDWQAKQLLFWVIVLCALAILLMFLG